MKKIAAINASPRIGWNTWSMVNETAPRGKIRRGRHTGI